MPWIQRGWIADGWIQMTAVVPPPVVIPPPVVPTAPDPPAVITLSPHGQTQHMTALGTVEGINLINARPASPVPLYYDTPVVILALPQGWIVSGTKTVRDGIAGDQRIVVSRADLLDVSSVNIRTAPLSSNLLGTLTLGERPSGTITLSDADGFWTRLIGHEGPALVGCNAGVYIDFSNSVLIPALVGTVGHFRLANGELTLEIGDFKRSLNATFSTTPTASVNLDDYLELRTAAEYSKPADAEAILPRVYGDFITTNAVPADDDDGGLVPSPSLNTDEWVYCVHDGTLNVTFQPRVYVNNTAQSPGVYEYHPNEDYQSKGVLICYVKFLINPGEAEISTRLWGQVNALQVSITNPLRAIMDCFITRGRFHSYDFDPTTCEQTARDEAYLGWQIHWVFNERKTYREWLAELGMNFLFDFLPNAYGQLSITHDRSLTTLPVQAIVDVDATVDCASTDWRGNTVAYDVDEANLINAIELEWQYDWTNNTYTETAPIADPHGITLHDWRARTFSLRGVRTLHNASVFTGSIFARYDFMPATVRFSVAHLRFIAAQPGTYIAFTWPQHGWDRRLLKVLNVEMDVMGRQMTWECMDCGRAAAEPIVPNVPQVQRRKRRRTFRILPRFRGIPLIPLGLSLSTGTIQGYDGTYAAFVRATWVPVPQMHLQNYIVQLTLEGTTTPIVLTPPIDVTEARFEGLPGLVSCSVRVAVQSIDEMSPFGPAKEIVTAADTVPPQPPTGLGVVGGSRMFHCVWNPPPDKDIASYTIWASPTPNIHEGGGVWNGLAVRAHIHYPNTPIGTVRWFWVLAQDRSGNASAWSPNGLGPGVQATLDGLSQSDLRFLVAARLGTGSDNLLVNADAEAGLESVAAEGWHVISGIPMVPYSGAFKYGERCFAFNHGGADIDSWSVQYFPVWNNEVYELSGWISTGAYFPSGSGGTGAWLRAENSSGISAWHILQKRTHGADPFPSSPVCGIAANDISNGWSEVWVRFRVSGEGIIAVGPQVGLSGGQAGFVQFDGLIFRRLHRIRTDDMEEGAAVKRFFAGGGTASISAETIFATVSISQLFQTGLCVVMGRANISVPAGAIGVLRVRRGNAAGTLIAEAPFSNTTAGPVSFNARVTDEDITPPWNGLYVLTVAGVGGTVTVNSSSITVLHHMRASN